MEKNAVNKLGLFLIIVIALAFFGGGGYLLYKNRNKFYVNRNERGRNKKKTIERYYTKNRNITE